jgi:hypothetical protein
MNITLRKANALQTAIQDHIKTIDVILSVSLNEFQSFEPVLQASRDTAVANDFRRTLLTRAVYTIRSLVGRANVESGVADLLTEAAYLDKRLAQLKTLTESKVVEDSTVILGKLEKIRNDKNENSRRSIYGIQDTVDTGVLTLEQIDGYKSEIRGLKKIKQSISDKVLELNVRTEITLDEATVVLLQAEQLV